MKEVDYIDHQGKVIEANAHFISVEILNKSACSSCHAQGFCSMGDVKAKIVEVENSGTDFFEVGEIVNVKLKKTLGYKALWLSYLIPLIILMVLLLSLHAFGVSEPIIGLSIIGSISLYYLIIWLLRDRFKREFIFVVEKL
ncbi:MAG: SoxR reducing system RseC family protein [Bacteroidales bacterium]|nr:SoxR reducing system RseC family protein [Bacteroidales bacterium]MDD4656198.1 SoxR reducing system RseC family protein [Bacteroidales bacterium]